MFDKVYFLGLDREMERILETARSKTLQTFGFSAPPNRPRRMAWLAVPQMIAPPRYRDRRIAIS